MKYNWWIAYTIYLLIYCGITISLIFLPLGFVSEGVGRGWIIHIVTCLSPLINPSEFFWRQLLIVIPIMLLFLQIFSFIYGIRGYNPDDPVTLLMWIAIVVVWLVASSIAAFVAKKISQDFKIISKQY